MPVETISDERKLNKIKQKVEAYLKSGNAVMAMPLIKKMLESGVTGLSSQYRSCRELILRRAWRKKFVGEFIEYAENDPKYTLTIARMQGKDALKKLANETDESALLSQCILSVDVKEAFRLLRRHSSLQGIAEGWLALLKFDSQRANARFSELESMQPHRAKIGKAIACLMRGDYPQAEELLQPIRKYAIHLFPTLTEIMGWKHDQPSNKDTVEKHIHKILIHGKLNEVKRVLDKLKNDKHHLKPWLQLRLGDLYAAEGNLRVAEKFWLKVERKQPELCIDVYKRLMHSYCNQDVKQMIVAFSKLYDLLQKKDTALAREFLETLAFNDDFQQIADLLPVHHYLDDENPSVEWILMLLKQNLFVWEEKENEVGMIIEHMSVAEKIYEWVCNLFPFGKNSCLSLINTTR